jgi:hypothetical protein
VGNFDDREWGISGILVKDRNRETNSFDVALAPAILLSRRNHANGNGAGRARRRAVASVIAT